MELHHLLDSIPIFVGLNSSELRSFYPFIRERSMKRGTIVCLEGTVGDEMYMIKQGSVKVYNLLEEKEVILSFLREGDYFGEMALMEEDQTRSATVETLEETILYVLNRRDYLSLLQDNPTMAIRIMQITMERLRSANERIQYLNVVNARSRIIKTILHLCREFGINSGQDILIDLKITHQQMASLTGFARETVSEALANLRKEGLIQIEQKKIRVKDFVTLEEQAGI